MSRAYHNLVYELSNDEKAKLRALGGVSWVRLQLRSAEMPRRGRTVQMLTAEERDMLLQSVRPAAELSRELGIPTSAIYTLRSRVRRGLGPLTPDLYKRTPRCDLTTPLPPN